MILVVDTNIVFSGILSPDGTISDILLNSQGDFEFYSPTSILDELENHREKLIRLSRYKQKELDFLKRMILRKIHLIDLAVIAEDTWNEAYKLTSNIDESDTPFLALTIELEALLWTGDKKLMNGLLKKGFHRILNTHLVKEIRDAE